MTKAQKENLNFLIQLSNTYKSIKIKLANNPLPGELSSFSFEPQVNTPGNIQRTALVEWKRIVNFAKKTFSLWKDILCKNTSNFGSLKVFVNISDE